MKSTAIIVVGALHTDVIVSGIPDFPKPGGYRVGRQFQIGAGGKSCNIAQMIARLTADPSSVAMISRTTTDVYGLWRPPYDALVSAGVDTDYIVFTQAKDDLFPGMAIIPVDEHGNNEIFVSAGESSNFSPEDVEAATSIFNEASSNNGILALSLECPLPTAIHSIRKAVKSGLKVVLDPGGLEASMEVQELLSSGIYIIKPNGHEAEMLTGIEVTDLESAQRAASVLLARNSIRYVLVTAGKNGAYLFGDSIRRHFATPDVVIDINSITDETGCGDQATAALCAFLSEGSDIEEAAMMAVAAGTLQFHRAGIVPITRSELEAFR